MDIWDWLKSLRRWWWMIVVIPVIAAAATWVLSPSPQYETTWTVNVIFDEPNVANSPGYIDFILLDDLSRLMTSGALGDVMYARLPAETQDRVSRDEFGRMISSARKARWVEITVSGDDPDIVKSVAETIDANLETVTNEYLVPLDYRGGPAVVNVLDPLTEPAINSSQRIRNTVVITAAAGVFAVAATGVAEWLRMSYRAKYSVK